MSSPWIQTFSGKKFYPFDPRIEDIDIKDIAHSLSLICRYNGHCKYFYSVAEHCVRMVDIVSEENKLWALLHDAAEAYIGDICIPIKDSFYVDKSEGFTGFEPESIIAIEDAILEQVAEKFSLTWENCDFPKEVHEADMIMAATEKRDIIVDSGLKWRELPKPLKERIIPNITPPIIERRFLQTFEKLYKGKLVENTSYR